MKFFRTNLRERISFGSHKGMRANELPTTYLEWMKENTDSKKWREISKKVLDERKNE